MNYIAPISRIESEAQRLLTYLLTYLHDVWLINIWQLEHGQKLLKCQEKPYSVHKMQENAWHSTRGAYSAPPDLLAGGQRAGCPLPRTPPPLSALRASPVLAP